MSDPRETLARIRAQADAATEGPWTAEGGFVEPSRADLPTIVECSDPEEHDVYNAEFIAASRTTVPRLVDALRSVLNLHFRPQPIPAAYGTQTGLDYCRTCAEDWPCTTVATITRAVEGDTP